MRRAARPKDPSGPILQPGRNCWQIAIANRAAVLVDGSAYFASLEAALRRARRSILILGWDFDGRIRLRPDMDPALSPPLGPLLRSLVEAQPDLEIRILVWSVGVVHAPSAPGPLLFGAEWQDHPRLHLKLDTQHPLYAAHHQKIVCVDDRVAFVGGIDLTIRRWDTSLHSVDNPFRLQPDGTLYHPVHDVQMAVDADAACRVADLARRRWQAATGEELEPPVKVESHSWPPDLSADFTGIRIAIARTMPAWNGHHGIAEVAALTVDALGAARRTVYIEAQYMTAPLVADVLERQLRKQDGPEILVVMTRESHGFAERVVMGTNRDRLIRRLRQADHRGRLRVYYPCVRAPGGRRQQVLVHSKLIVVDDVFLRVGSSNLNNRSMGLDTECDLAIEATDERTRRAIKSLRNRLVGEHLDATTEDVASAIDIEGGSLVRAVDRLNRGPRGLEPFPAMTDGGPTRPVPGTRLLDPKRPFAVLPSFRRPRRQG